MLLRGQLVPTAFYGDVAATHLESKLSGLWVNSKPCYGRAPEISLETLLTYSPVVLMIYYSKEVNFVDARVMYMCVWCLGDSRGLVAIACESQNECCCAAG